MPNSILIDIGANLADTCFQDDQRQVIERAVAVGVTTMIVTGTSLASNQAALDLSRQYPQAIYATAGIHPHSARNWNRHCLEMLRKLAGEPKVVAIGECGLDFNRNFSTPAQQERCFEEQIMLACELRKPLFLHERDANERLLAILDRYQKELPPTVVHCFTGNGQDLDSYLARNFYIGITGWICDERRGLHLQELVKKIPLTRLMLETDAPYLTPRTMRNRPNNGRNEPGFLPYVLTTIAKSLHKPEAEVAEATTATARSFFQLA